MEDFLCACTLAIHALDFYMHIQKKKFMPPKQNVGRGGGGYFVKIYQKRIKYMLKIENCEHEVEKKRKFEVANKWKWISIVLKIWV